MPASNFDGLQAQRLLRRRTDPVRIDCPVVGTYGLLFSALSIVTLPMIVIYIVFNRQIVEGITAGSLK